MSETQEIPAGDILQFRLPTFDLRHAFEEALAPAGRSDDDDGEEDGDDDDSDNDAEEQGSEDDDKDDDDEPSEAQLRSREAAKYRQRAKEERKKREDLERRLRELEDKGNDDDKAKLERDLNEAQEAVQAATTGLEGALLRASLAEAQLEHGKFKDPEYADFLLRKALKDEDVEVEDGEVVGMDEWVKALAKKKPELFVSSGDDKEDEDDSEDEDEDEDQRSRKSDSGKPKSSKKKKSSLDDEVLLQKFPALRR